MSLKAFVNSLTIGASQLESDGPIYGICFVQEAGVVVLENGTPVLEPGTNSPFRFGLLSLTLNETFGSGDTYGTIRQKIQHQVVNDFNTRLSRSDGNTITFVWLDDKGLL